VAIVPPRLAIGAIPGGAPWPRCPLFLRNGVWQLNSTPPDTNRRLPQPTSASMPSAATSSIRSPARCRPT